MSPQVAHLECTRCARRYESGKARGLCECGSPLWVRYGLNRGVGARLAEQLAVRPATMWRYREVLPVLNDASIVSLGEGYTPLHHARRLGERLGLANLYLKDESRNPTGSFKARGLSVAVSMARELGIEKLAIASVGNAGGALAAYAAKAGLRAAVLMPEDTPRSHRLECALAGAEVVLVAGDLRDCARALAERAGREAWFDVSTLREPFRLEGEKTMAYEIYEQLGGRLPDAMIYPTGGGTGLIGMWKALGEMAAMGWIGERRPRLFAVQSSGCAPLVRAWGRGAETMDAWPHPKTVAVGLRVPAALGDFLMLGALRESAGTALAVDDVAMLDAVRELAQTEGVLTSPEGGATLAALRRLLADGFLAGYETIVLFLTASGHKYIEALEGLARTERG